MTTLISLNNQAFWTPPVPHLAKPRYERSSEQGQNQETTLPALGLNPSPSHDMIVISSDEESDADNTNDEADMANYLPSISEIIARQEVERGCADTAGEQALLARAYLDGR